MTTRTAGLRLEHWIGIAEKSQFQILRFAQDDELALRQQ
jgi:hypothetical protein